LAKGMATVDKRLIMEEGVLEHYIQLLRDAYQVGSGINAVGKHGGKGVFYVECKYGREMYLLGLDEKGQFSLNMLKENYGKKTTEGATCRVGTSNSPMRKRSTSTVWDQQAKEA
jgi:hypothetical protein